MTTETSGTFIALGSIEEALKKVAAMMQHDMLIAFDTSGGKDPWAPLKYRTGKPLVLTGALRGSGEATAGADFAQVTAGRGMMHAAIHQWGGTTHPTFTDRMRSFYWAKWYETHDTKWKAMALGHKVGEKLTIRIPARPFLSWTPEHVADYQRVLLGMVFTTQPITIQKVAA